MSSFDTPGFAAWFAGAISLFAFALWCLMPTDVLVHLVEEGQLVENITLAGYAIVILWLMISPIPQSRPLTRLATSMVLLAMMAREADLHQYIAHMSMLKLRFWTGALPGMDKLYAAALLAPIIVACVYLFWQHAAFVIKGLKSGRSHAVTIGVFLGLIILTNAIDRSLGLIKEQFGWHAPEWLVALQTSQEEFLELSLPLLALIAALQYRRYVLRRLDTLNSINLASCG